MFRTKSEVDVHVKNSLQKLKTEKERNFRSLHAAQLYIKVGDFESARKYVLMYLSEKADSASAHKLHGDTLEGLGQKSKAIAAYTRSLELDASQPGLFLKICELLCDKDVEFNPSIAKYCLDHAGTFFPHAPAVFSLREKLLSTDSSVTQDDIEKLVVSELKARPADVNVRVKLLKLQLESNKVDLAYSHVIDVEEKQLHNNSQIWYQCSSKIFKAYYDSFPKKCNWEFFVMWMSALDHLCFLSLNDSNGESSDVVSITESIYTLDQTIYLASQKVSKAPEIYLEFMRHISAQLAFHIVVLLMIRAKKEASLWKETKKNISPLLLFSVNDPPNTDANWSMSIKETHRKMLNSWVHNGRCRYAQSGYLLNALIKECQTNKMFLDKVNHFVATDWRKKLFEKMFLPVDDVSSTTSHFVTSSNYANVPQKIPLVENLHTSLYVQSFEVNYVGSLHHLVWLGVQFLLNSKSILTSKISPTFHSTQFKNLQLTVSNLHNTGVETLNQLDIDAFLYATVLCASAVLDDQQMNGYYSPDRPTLLPADITATLCNTEQLKWWTSACALSKGGGRGLGNNVKMSDLRHSLQRGIEVVRGDGLPLPVLACVARTFGFRGSEADSIEESDACESRAVDLWRNAVPILEKLASNLSTKSAIKTTLFEYSSIDMEPNEINSLLDEARYFIGNYYMGKEQYEKALDVFKLLRSPLSNYNMAMIYYKLAEEQVSGRRSEEITSGLRCKQQVLGRKAREALLAAREAVKGDHNHTLQNKIKSLLIEVDDLLSRSERENGIGRDGIATDDSYSYESQDGESVEKLATPLKHIKNLSRIPAAASTPRNYEAKLHHNAEMVEILSSQQETNQLKLTQIMEQSKLLLDRVDSVIFEQRSQRSLMEDLTAKFNRMETDVRSALTDIKKEIKRPDLYNMLDDDDYTADEMLQYPVYPPVNSQLQSRVVVYPNQRPPATEPQFPTTVPQFFSPRLDQMYQNGMNFFNTQGTLPFVDGQTVPDYLRGLSQPKFPTQLQNTLGAPIHAAAHLNTLTSSTAGIPGLTTGLMPQQRVNIQAMGLGVPDQGLGGRGPNNIVITTSDTLPTGTPPAQPTLSVTIPPQHRLGDSPATHQFQLYFPDFNSILKQVKEYSVFTRQCTVYKYIDHKWEEDAGSIHIIRSNIDAKFGIVMVHGKSDDLWANHMLTADMKFELCGENSWSWVVNNLVSDKIEKLKVKFNTAADASSFKRECDELLGKPKGLPSSLVSHSNVPTENKSIPKTEPQRSSILAPSHFSFAPPQQAFSSPKQSSIDPKPLQSTSSVPNQSLLFGKQQTNTSLFGKDVPKTTSGSTTAIPSTTSNSKTTFGGFTFSSAPTLSNPVEPKPLAQKPVEVKKADTTFANFSFSKSSQSTTGFFSDQAKPIEAAKSDNKQDSSASIFNPMFSPSSQFSDFGSFAKATANHEFLKPSSDVTTQSGATTFAGSGAPVFSSQMKLPQQSQSHLTTGQQDSPTQENVDEFVPTAVFQPLIPLPALVDVVSGEENETVLFSERSKLFRYNKENKEWRDRGIGIMKILKNNSGVVRLLMRREHVLKVCCNHRLTKDLVITKSKTNDKAYCWIAADFSDDTNGSTEQFTIKFKTAEQAAKFESSFKTAQELSADSPSRGEKINSPHQSAGDQKTTTPATPLSAMFKKKEGSWDCNVCYITNDLATTSCLACNTPKPGTETSPKKDQKPKSTFTFGMPAASATENSPASVKSPLPVQVNLDNSRPKVGGFTFGMPTSESSGGFAFGSNSNNKTLPYLSSAFGSSGAGIDGNKGSQLGNLLKSNEESWECKTCNAANKAVLMHCNKCSTPRTIVTLSAASSGSAQTFSFDNLAATLPTSQPTNLTEEVTLTVTTSDGTKKEHSSSGLDFGFGTNNKSGAPIFSFGGSETPGKKSFQFSMSPSNAKSPSRNDSITSEHDMSDREESEDNIHFQPVVPLPDLVAVKTGEEEEQVLYSQRSKLFRYDVKAKEWKERGLGDIKIMEHVTTGKKRLLMRREPVKKLCLNHYLTDEIVLTAKDEKSWTWLASDFALGEISRESFAIRFKTKEIAQEFYDAVQNAIQGKSELIQPSSEATSGDSSSESNDDVVYVTTITASDDLKAKARSLMLPENFYLYLGAPPCPGCPGCEYEDDSDEKVQPALGSFKFITSTESPSKLETQDKTVEAANPFAFKTAVKNSESPAVNESPLKPVDSAVPISQPIFGTAPSSVFSFNSANFSFGQKFTTSTEKASPQSSQQPFFSSSSFSISDNSSTPESPSIFGNVGSQTKTPQIFSQPPAEQPSLFNKAMASFGSVASSNPQVMGNVASQIKTPQIFSQSPAEQPSLFNKVMPSFGSVASSSPQVMSFGEEGQTSLFNKAEPSMFSLMSRQEKNDDNDGGDDNDPEKEGQGIHFEPIIPLPDEIKLSTGEEDEDVLFSERCKLYRFSEDKKWKERGTGIMKVLKHKTNNTYRMLMRREQVFKVVCNQRITADLDMKPMATQANSLTWAAMNLPQELTEPQIETLALKLKNEDVMSTFLSVVKEAIGSMK